MECSRRVADGPRLLSEHSRAAADEDRHGRVSSGIVGKQKEERVKSSMDRRPRIMQRAGRSLWIRGLAGLAATLVLASCASSTTTSGDSGAASSKRNGAAASLTSSTSAPFVVATTPWGTQVSYNPYSPTTFDLGYALLPLANRGATYSSKTKSYKYFYTPYLAKSWTATPSQITLHLRSARWQNGQPFTSTDVATSLLLAGADNNDIWADISGVKTIGQHTVVIDLTASAVVTNVLESLFLVPIVSSSQYRQLLPSGFQSDLVSYYRTYNIVNPTNTSINQANDSPAGKTVARVDKALLDYNPPTLVGDGPYQLVASNATDILFKKWSGWWDAKAIRVPSVELLALNTSEQFSAIKTDRADFQEDTLFLDTEIAELKGTEAKVQNFVQPKNGDSGLYFNQADYPYNLLGVRQALAYLIDRPRLAKEAMAGKIALNQPQTYPDSLPIAMNQQFLSASQRRQLNTYSYSPRKATALLQRAGFRKKGSTWYLPTKKPFKVTIYAAAGTLRMDQEALVAANMLSSFGIKTSVDEVETPAFATQQEAGAYPVSINFLPGGTSDPISFFETTFATYNYPATYSGKGTCAGCHHMLGMPAVATVPGLGRVVISVALNRELQTAKSDKWATYAWDWARFVNENLPVLPLTDTGYHGAYNATRYRHWPSSTDVSAWLHGSEGSGNVSYTLIDLMQHGYIRPAK